MSQYKKPAPAPELRRRVYTCIDKLSDRATLSQAITELEFIARNLPSDSLPCFLSCILSVDASSKSAVRVHCLNLLSILAQTHQDFLCPHFPKIIVPGLIRRLRDCDSAVRAALSTASASVAPLGFSAVLGPFLATVLTEQDSNAQMGSCLSLKAAVDSAAVVGDSDEEELRRAVPKMLKLVKGEGFKAKAALLGLIASIVGVNGGGVVNGRGGLVGNVVGCAVEMLSFEDWAARKAAAEVLEAMALAAERESAREVKRFVVGSLETRRFDKVKITRETMNRALNAWKNVPGGPEEDLLLPRSSPSISKDNGCHGGSLLSRRSSFAGWETPKPKKTIVKTRSSLSDGPVASICSSNSTTTHDFVRPETPQRKKTISKSRSSLSDDSTITDSSSISKCSHDGGFETPQSNDQMPKSVSSLPEDIITTVAKKKTASKGNDEELSAFPTRKYKRTLDWKSDIAPSPAPSVKVVEEDNMHTQRKTVEVNSSGSETRSNFFKNASEEMVQKVTGFRTGSPVVPFAEEEETEGLILEDGANEEVRESNADVEDLSVIRNQLHQIERQQSNLLGLLQRFMGNSQSGIDSLETRVSGLERALDEISYDLAVQSGRIPENDAAASTCCPSTDFLSPKFWRREARSSISKSSCVVSVLDKDGNIKAPQMDGHRLQEVKEGIWRDSWGSVEVSTTKTVKGIGQNVHRARTCSPRSSDGASTAACKVPEIPGA